MMKLKATQQMTKLPATLKEAEALNFVHEYNQALSTPWFTEDNPWSGYSALSPEASRAFCANLMTHMLQSAESRMWLVEAAKAGEAGAVDLLQSALLECKSRKIAMTTELEEYDLWITRHGVRRRRRSEAMNFPVRDIGIAQMVAEIVTRYDLKPTGRSARFRSACSIVAEALGMSYEAVVIIWQRHERHVAPDRASKKLQRKRTR
jgi:hypothetical protein